MESPAMTNMDVLGFLVEMVPLTQFLFFAPVSSSWRTTWGQRPAWTSYTTADTSVTQLQYSFECGLSRDCSALCSTMARLGELEALQCARENGCFWDWKTCQAAAGAGHLELLQWARQSGC